MTSTGPSGPPVPRRTVLAGVALLAAGGAAALAGCSAGEPSPAPRPDPDVALRLRVAVEVRQLLAAYAAVIAVHPTTGPRLRPLAAETRAHDRALTGPPGAIATPTTPGSASATTGSAPLPSASPVPVTAAAAVAWLAGLERDAAVRRRTELLRAGPDLARLLASVGASEATHAALLQAPVAAR